MSYRRSTSPARFRLHAATMQAGETCRRLRRALGEPPEWDAVLCDALRRESARLVRACRARGIDPDAALGHTSPARSYRTGFGVPHID